MTKGFTVIQPFQKKMIASMPKAENHIHIEGSIPLYLALELAEKNHVKLPVIRPRAAPMDKGHEDIRA